MADLFRSSTTLQTPVAPLTKSVTLGTTLESKATVSASEERYWTTHYGLGSTGKTRPPPAKFQPTSAQSMVDQIVVSPSASPGDDPQMAVVSGPRVSLYHGHATGNLTLRMKARQKSSSDPVLPTSLFGEQGDSKVLKGDRSIATGGVPAHCAAYRADGRLLAVGTADGGVKICDTSTRATLRTLGGRGKFAIRSVAWKRDGKHILAGGDDGILRIWNIAGTGTTEPQPVSIFRGHGDAIRSCLLLSHNSSKSSNSTTKDASSPLSQWTQLAVTGSYDHTIRIWDLQTESDDTESACLAVMDHGSPVETLLMIPPGAFPNTKDDMSNVPLLLSAGGTTIKVWHPLTGRCLSTIATKHSKAITSLCLTHIISGDSKNVKSSPPRYRILTGGLDGLVRIHVLQKDYDLACVHGHKIPDASPITAIICSPNQRRIVMGTSLGLVVVYDYPPPKKPLQKKPTPRAGTFGFFQRGTNVEADPDDFVALVEKRKRLRTYDVALRQFRYGDALDTALRSRQPQSVTAVLEELGRRRGLTVALSNRDEETLEPILSFLVRYITKPKFTPLLVGVADILCEIYGGVAGQSETIDELFHKLRFQVDLECRTQRTLLRLLGQIDCVMTAADMKEMDEQQN